MAGREAITERMTTFRKRFLIALLTMLGVTCTLAVASETHPATHGQAAVARVRPNVLVIETDDQTRGSMQVMDYVKARIGNKGARFRNNFVNFSLCCPSRATFLTGQYAHNHGVLGNNPPFGGFDG